jgi:addiction module HigA family antidote
MPLLAIHPGEHLAEELKELNMSAASLARQLQVPTNRITQILNGRRDITADTALRLAHFFGTSAEFWINLQGLYDLRIAPRGIPEAAIQYCHIMRQAGPGAYVSAHGDVDGVVANILHAMRCGTTVSPATAKLEKRFSKELLIPQMIGAIERSRNEQSSLTHAPS